jgi:hypothetical protein
VFGTKQQLAHSQKSINTRRIISFILGTVIPNVRKTEESQPSVTEHSARQNNTQGDSSFRFGMTGFEVSISRKENRMIDVTIYESGQKTNIFKKIFLIFKIIIPLSQVKNKVR